MKTKFLILLAFIPILFVPIVRGENIIGTTYVEAPFYPNQRAICRDDLNNIHVVWLYNSTHIGYAKSEDEGNSWTIIYFSYPSS